MKLNEKNKSISSYLTGKKREKLGCHSAIRQGSLDAKLTHIHRDLRHCLDAKLPTHVTPRQDRNKETERKREEEDEKTHHRQIVPVATAARSSHLLPPFERPKPLVCALNAATRSKSHTNYRRSPNPPLEFAATVA